MDIAGISYIYNIQDGNKEKMRKNKGIWMIAIFALIAGIIGLISVIPIGGFTMILYGTFFKNYGEKEIIPMSLWLGEIIVSIYFIWRHKE